MDKYSHLISNTQKLANNKAYYLYHTKLGRQSTSTDFKRMYENYLLADGDIDHSLFKNITHPFGPNIKLPTTFRHKDIISSTIKRVVGNASTRKFKNRIVAINKEAVGRKRYAERQKYAELIDNSVKNELYSIISKSIPKDLPNREDVINEELLKNTPENIKKYMRKQHVDNAEQLAEHIKLYSIKEQDVDTTFTLCSHDAACVGKYLFYVGIENRKAVLKRLDPRSFTYIRSTNSPFVKDFDQGTVHMYLSLSKIQEYWGDVIDDAILMKIDKMGNNESHDVAFAFSAIEPQYGYTSMIMYDNSQKTAKKYYVTHSIWRAFTKKGILRFIDKSGIEQISIVDESYILNKDIGDISIEWKQVQELHECIVCGNDIIIKAGPVEGQIFDIDNLYHKDLPFHGCLLNSYGDECKGLVDYQKEYAILYDIILYRVEDFMSKDKGKLTFMHQDMLPIEPDKFFAYAEKNNIAFYNTQNLKNIQKDVSNLVKEVDRSQVAKIDQYINLANYIELKIKTVVGINPQFEGEIQEREGQRNVEKAIGASSLALEPMFYLMDIAKNHAIKALVYNQIMCFIKYNKSHIDYVLDEAGIMSIDIDKNLLIESQFTMFMEDGTKQQKIIDILTSYAAAKAQTDQLELSAFGRFLEEEDLNSALSILEDSEEMKYLKNMELEKQRTSNAQNEIKLKLDSDAQLETIKHKNKLEEIAIKGEWDVIKSTVIGSGFAEDKDINNNNTPDIIEIAKGLIEQQKLQHDIIQSKIKNIQENRKLDIEEKKIKKQP